MNNRNLQSKIERAAGVCVKAKGIKMQGDDRFEAYVDAYEILDGVKSRKAKASTSAWLASERAYAVRWALVKMADKLNVTITEDERTAVERAEGANNQARMNLYRDTH